MRITAIACTRTIAIVTQEPNLLDRLFGRQASTAAAVLLPAPGGVREWCWSSTRARVSKRVERVIDRALMDFVDADLRRESKPHLRVVRQPDDLSTN